MQEWYAVLSSKTAELAPPPPRSVSPVAGLARDAFKKWQARIGEELSRRYLAENKVKIAGPFKSRKEAREARYETSPTNEELN